MVQVEAMQHPISRVRTSTCACKVRITANCLRPVFYATRFGNQSGGLISRLVWVPPSSSAISPAKGTGNDLLSRPRRSVRETTGDVYK